MTISTTELWSQAIARGMPERAALLVVEVACQSMTCLSRGLPWAVYRVSTSKKGLGHVMDSFRTPTGWHEVVERYGAGEPAGRVFFEREPTDRILPEAEWATEVNSDLIMTRILRLAGLEEGVNRGAPWTPMSAMSTSMRRIMSICSVSQPRTDVSTSATATSSSCSTASTGYLSGAGSVERP